MAFLYFAAGLIKKVAGLARSVADSPFSSFQKAMRFLGISIDAGKVAIQCCIDLLGVAVKNGEAEQQVGSQRGWLTEASMRVQVTRLCRRLRAIG